MDGKTFIFREEWLDILDCLTQKQQDSVIRAMISHAFGRKPCNLSKVEQVAFASIRGAIDRDMEKFESRKLKNQENGRKGGRPRLEKTQNNPEKPNGFSVSESVSNPIPIPISSNPITKGVTTSSPSLSSPSSGQVEGEIEEEQKEERNLLSYFFFEKKFLRPERELERMRSFNSLPDRKVKWSDMSPEERRGIAGLWISEEQKKAEKEGRDCTKQRMAPEQYDLWRNVFETLVGTDAPEEVIRDALLDGVTIDKLGEKTRITCPDRLRSFMERHLQEFIPAMKAYAPITYKIIPQWSQ